MRWLSLALLSACSLYPGGTGHGDDICNGGLQTGSVELVDPVNLTCQTFTSVTCDPTCGPCPAIASPAPPSWGECQSECTGLDEATCEATASCRVALNCDIYYGNGTSSFLGCFRDDHTPPSGSTCKGLDAEACSEHSECAGLYQVPLCNSAGCAVPKYMECIPEHQVAGLCTGPLSCDIAQPPCPTGTTAGIANGCYTGSCIPNDHCVP